jgi:hypothetical protein
MFLRILLVFGLTIFSSDLLAKDVGGKTVPISGFFSGYLLDFNVDPGVIADRCNPPDGKFAWAVTSFEGWGTMTHLGNSYMYADHCSYGIPGAGPDGTYGEGEITVTASNGDILLATYTGGISFPSDTVIGFMDHFTFIDGGTGRFTFASGGGVDVGTVNFDDFSFTIQMTGVIAYQKK